MKELMSITVSSEGGEVIEHIENAISGLGMNEILAQYGMKLLWAICTVIFGHFIVKWVLRIIMDYIRKNSIASGATSIIKGVVAFLLYFVVLLTAANIVGIPVTSVLAIFSVFTLAFSLAIKDIIALFASGITILLSKPFVPGDLVEIPEENVSGYVSEVGLIHTHLFTIDNKEIIIPNSIVAADTLINFSKIGMRRLDSVFSIAYNEDIEKAKSIIREVAENEPLVSKEKDIFIGVNALGPSSVDIICKVYVKWDLHEDLRCIMNEKVKKAFDENKIEIPYNQLDVHMR